MRSPMVMNFAMSFPPDCLKYKRLSKPRFPATPKPRPGGQGATAIGLRRRHSPSAAGNHIRAAAGYQPASARSAGRPGPSRNRHKKRDAPACTDISRDCLQHRTSRPPVEHPTAVRNRNISLFKAEESIRASQAGLLTEPHRAAQPSRNPPMAYCASLGITAAVLSGNHTPFSILLPSLRRSAPVNFPLFNYPPYHTTSPAICKPHRKRNCEIPKRA